MPEVPTMVEAGLPDLGVPTWQALSAPPGTPADAAARLSSALRGALDQPALRERLEQLGLQPDPSSPERLATVAAESEVVWRRFVTDCSVPTE